MQSADRVAERRRLNRADRHRKWLVMILGAEAAQRQKPLERYARFGAIVAKVFIQQAGFEKVDAGRHRSVGGEDVIRAASLQRVVKGQLVLLDEAPHALDGQESRMAFVHVPDRGLETQP